MTKANKLETGEQMSKQNMIRVNGYDPELDDEYTYKTIEEYEEIVGFKVNDAFRIGWDMARTKNKHLRQLTESS